MNESIDKYVKKTQRYYYDDGLVEIIIGLLMAGVGAALVLILSIEASSPFVGVFLFLGITAAAVGAAVLVKRWVNKIKEQITFSRTGYVSYPHDEPDRGRWFLLVVVVGLTAVVLLLPSELNTIQFFFGSLLAAVLFYIGYRMALRRFYITGIVCFLIGSATAIWIDDEFSGAAMALVLCGLVLLLSGTLALGIYLRKNPEPGADQS